MGAGHGAQAGGPDRDDVRRRGIDDPERREGHIVTETPNPNIIDADTLTGEMRPIRRVVLALGSNLGDRMTALQGAVEAIADTPEVWVTSVSPVYETEPVDAPEGSDPY